MTSYSIERAGCRGNPQTWDGAAWVTGPAKIFRGEPPRTVDGADLVWVELAGGYRLGLYGSPAGLVAVLRYELPAEDPREKRPE